MDASTLLQIVRMTALPPQQRLDVLEQLLASTPSGVVSPSTHQAPHTGDVVPSTVNTAPLDKGNVIIPVGGICECALCNKPIYAVEYDVHEQMKIVEFINAFTPISPSIPSMDRNTDIYGDPYGNLAVNCPLCKGIKTVWIKGKGEYDSVPDTKENALK